MAIYTPLGYEPQLGNAAACSPTSPSGLVEFTFADVDVACVLALAGAEIY
jgi:hypothetical protein